MPVMTDTQDEQRYRICLLVQPGNPHAACFTDLAVLLKSSLLSLGKPCDIAINDPARDRVNILLGANTLNPDTFSISCPYIVYQLEQLSDSEGWYSDSKLRILENAVDVWDYSRENIVFLSSHGIRAKYLLPGYHPALEQIANRDDKDIDVLFFGSINERRKKVLNELVARGVKVKTLFGVYGKQRDEVIAGSKVILNMHFYDASIFEAVRVSYLLNNRCFVVSEESSDCPYNGVDMALCAYENIAETCSGYLGNPGEMSRLCCRNYEEFRSAYPMPGLVGSVLGSETKGN